MQVIRNEPLPIGEGDTFINLELLEERKKRLKKGEVGFETIAL